jgi:hypothetical protein
VAPGHGCEIPHPAQPSHEVADIFRVHGEAYREAHPTTLLQRAVMRDIEICRTSVLGGHLDVCPDCGYEKPSYNSCRNRHCPKCQALAQARWLDRRRERILPIHYFHVVFTLPSELRPLAMANRRLCFDILFRAASDTLRTLAKNPRWLGAQIGFTAVLHTWTRDLRFHPHLHCIVTGGGLSDDGQRWVPARHRHLFPVKVLGRLFRGKVDAALAKAHREERLLLPDDVATPDDFKSMRRRLFAKDWVVYAKRPFAGAEQVYAYLGRYTHRVAISNHRILSVADDSVTIATRDGASQTMAPHVFIRRFLNHVLPKGFSKIRHYGLLASSNVNTKLEVARSLLEPDPVDQRPHRDAAVPADWQDTYENLTGIDLRICPACKRSRLRKVPLARRSPETTDSRAPPLTER